MSDAQQLLAAVEYLIEEVTDGFDVTLYKKPGSQGTFLQFLQGEVEECPIGFRIKPCGEEQPITTQ